jgi:hypothetical protein
VHETEIYSVNGILSVSCTDPCSHCDGALQRSQTNKHSPSLPAVADRRSLSGKIKCRVNHSQIHSQSTCIQLTPHFIVLDIWKGSIVSALTFSSDLLLLPTPVVLGVARSRTRSIVMEKRLCRATLHEVCRAGGLV